MKRRLISFDWAMKKLLRSKANFEILEGFLSELLKEEIQILEILESEANKAVALDKVSRLDLKVKNQKGEIILIEVQFEREHDYLQRVLFSTSKTITEHLAEGRPYSEVVKVISVNILYFDLGHGEDYIYHGKTVFRGVNSCEELQLSEKQKQLFQKHLPHELYPEYFLIKVNKFNDVAKNTLDEWMYFLKNEEIKDSFKAQGLKKAKEQLDILKLPENDRQAYERYSEDLHYQASMVQSSYGSGKLDGRAEGLEEGREKGREERDAELVKKMLAKGRTPQEIADLTDIPIHEVRRMADEKRK
jgi:predicted transposase/invertase (TIGR01784 family)